VPCPEWVKKAFLEGIIARILMQQAAEAIKNIAN
jgi:hypothetical protein